MRVAIFEATVLAEPEAAYLGPVFAIGIADRYDRIAGDEHFIVPCIVGIAVTRRECIDRRNRFEPVARYTQRKQAATAKDHKVIAGNLDDPAFVDSGFLIVRDLWCCLDPRTGDDDRSTIPDIGSLPSLRLPFEARHVATDLILALQHGHRTFRIV